MLANRGNRAPRGSQPALAQALAGALVLGVVSRRFPIGWWPWDKSAGDVLYAVAAYLVLALCLPRVKPARVAVVALLLCEAIEFFQLTGLPARYQHVPGVRWLLGTQFAWHDVACYAIGVGAVLVLDLCVVRPSRRGGLKLR